MSQLLAMVPGCSTEQMVILFLAVESLHITENVANFLNVAFETAFWTL